MTEHALELLHFALWLVIILGTGGIATMTWGGKKVLERLDVQDDTMEKIRILLATEIRQLREMQHALELRITRVEARCDIKHTDHGTIP